MTNHPNPNSAAQAAEPQTVLTDDEIRDIITGTHQAFGEFKSGYMLVLGRAIESALLSKLRAPVADERAAAINPEECNAEVYKHGTSVGLFAIPKDDANAICAGIAAATGARVDWHYIAGRVHIKALPALASAPVADNSGEKPAGFANCPITGMKFWGNIEHPSLGTVATYGGPFDTYTIPALCGDGELRSEHFDQDAGQWVEGGRPIGWAYNDQQDMRPMQVSAHVAGKAQKPVAWFIYWPGEPELGHCIAEDPADGGRNRPLFFADAAPQASAEAARNAALEEAAKEMDRLHAENRRWHNEFREAAAVVRALKQPQADKDGGRQRAAFDHPVFAFLLGEGPLHDVHFGDRHPSERGAYWWRKDLRAALSAAQAEQGERDA